jgi:subtilase family serine protease
VTVRNNGLLDAPASTLKLRLVSTGATPLQTGLTGDAAVPPIPTAAKVIVRVASVVDDDTEPGTYFVQACTDYSNVVAESSEKNNCTLGTETVTVTGLALSPADLAVTALTSPPPTRLPGETFALTATVKNHGTGASTATTSKFYLVNAVANPTLRKNLKGVQLLGPLAAGATSATPVTVEVYATPIPGNYFLQACADGDKLLREVNENDNCFTAPAGITVSQVPNLVVTQVWESPATAVPGRPASR